MAPASVNTGLEDDSWVGAAVGLSEGVSSIEEGGGCSNADCWDEDANVDCAEGCSVVCCWKVFGSADGCSEEGTGSGSVGGSWNEVEGMVVGSTIDCSELDDEGCGVGCDETMGAVVGWRDDCADSGDGGCWIVGILDEIKGVVVGGTADCSVRSEDDGCRVLSLCDEVVLVDVVSVVAASGGIDCDVITRVERLGVDRSEVETTDGVELDIGAAVERSDSDKEAVPDAKFVLAIDAGEAVY